MNNIPSDEELENAYFEATTKNPKLVTKIAKDQKIGGSNRDEVWEEVFKPLLKNCEEEECFKMMKSYGVIE